MKLKMELTAKQTIALDILEDNSTTSLIYGGGAGGGKSYLGCYWILKMAFKYPETRYLIGRKERATLKDTTLNTFFEVCNLMGMKQGIHYNYKDQRNLIELNNGSVILLKDLQHQPSDPNYDTLGGLELTAAFVDECNQITEKAWNVLRSRLRYKLTDYNLIPKLLGTCNPAKNWVYAQYYKPSMDGSLDPKRKFLQALITDNSKVSEFYIEELKTLPKAERERLLDGKWEQDDESALIAYDAILDTFNNNHVTRENEKKYLTCDVARMGSDKAVIALWRGFEVIELYEYPKSKINELQGEIMTIKTLHAIPNSNIVIDEDGVGGGLVDYIKGSRGFINNSKALNNENYYNLKTQCQYKLAEMINGNQIFISAELSSKQREDIIEEMEQIRSMNADMDSKLRTIPKSEVKSNIGRSPDYSDALMMRMLFEFGPKRNTVVW